MGVMGGRVCVYKARDIDRLGDINRLLHANKARGWRVWPRQQSVGAFHYK